MSLKIHNEKFSLISRFIIVSDSLKLAKYLLHCHYNEITCSGQLKMHNKNFAVMNKHDLPLLQHDLWSVSAQLFRCFRYISEQTISSSQFAVIIANLIEQI